MEKDGHFLTPLKDIMAGLFENGALPFSAAEARIWKVWDSVVGPAIAGHARPEWIKKGRLKVRVSDPIWLQELEFAQEEIRLKLNTRLAREVVRKIEFRMGPL